MQSFDLLDYSSCHPRLAEADLISHKKASRSCATEQNSARVVAASALELAKLWCFIAHLRSADPITDFHASTSSVGSSSSYARTAESTSCIRTRASSEVRAS